MLTLNICAAVAISIVVSWFFFLDLLFSAKSKRFFVRALAYLLGSSGLGYIFKEIWPIFCITLFLTLSICFFSTMVYHHLYMQKKKHIHSLSNSFDFLRLIWEGYPNFQKKLTDDIKAEEQKKAKLRKDYINLNNEMKEKLPEFIAKVYHNMYTSEFDAIVYCYTVMQLFIDEFLSRNDARFSIREFDQGTNSMKCVACTDAKSPPAPIPLSKKNLISLSVEKRGPVLYSRNMDWHCKGNGSIEEGKYNNYVSHCLLKSENNKPYISICLDVKGEKASDRLTTLFDSNILAIIFKALETQLQIKQETNTFNKAAA
jgi:hypothetical protein